jgi:hypothetical protein
MELSYSTSSIDNMIEGCTEPSAKSVIEKNVINLQVGLTFQV